MPLQEEKAGHNAAGSDSAPDARPSQSFAWLYTRTTRICAYVAAAAAAVLGIALLVLTLVLAISDRRPCARKHDRGAAGAAATPPPEHAGAGETLVAFRPGEGAAVQLSGGVQAETVSDSSPRVLYLHNLLTPLECEHIIRKYSKRLKPSKVLLAAHGKSAADRRRISLSAFLPGDGSDEVLSAVEKRVAECMDVNVRCLEPLQLLMYRHGHFYKPHYDWLEPSVLNSSGQRTRTLLVYLNDLSEGETGGGTAFWSTRKVVRPACGNAITWHNTTDGKGQGHEDRSTLHSGEPLVLKSSVKYVLNVWARERPYRSMD